MENQVDLLKRKYKYAADYALILAGYISFFYILSNLFPHNPVVNILTTAGFLGTFVVFYRLAVRYREKAWNGVIKFYQVWAFGVWLFFFAALLMAVVYYVHFQFIDPEYISRTFNETLSMLQQMNYPPKNLDALIESGVPGNIQIVIGFLWLYIIGGGILSLIVSPFVAKSPNSTSDSSSYTPYQDNNPENNA